MPRKGSENTVQHAEAVQIFLHGNSFCEGFKVLSSAAADPGVMMMVGTPVMVLSAFASEIFLKCLFCMETGKASRGHHLKHLFDRLSKSTQHRIVERWDGTVVPLRKPLWDAAQRGSKLEVPRDFHSALKAGNNAFSQMRYSYEPDRAKQISFFLADLPLVLRYVILELMPEWRHVSRTYYEVGPLKNDEPGTA